MSRLIFDADTLGGTTTLSSADAVGNFTLIVPAVDGTLSVKDASGDATFRNLTLTGAVLAGAWNGTRIGVAYGGTGATTLTGYVKGSGTSAMTASTTIPNTDITGLGTMSTQNASAVTITGGTADGLTLGGTTPAPATVTTLRINSTLSLAGTTGTSGQVLTSNGASAPTWQNIPGTGTVTSVDVSGGSTGLTTSGGPVTASGTITLAGTLALANGGTGATTAATARTALGLGTIATQAANAVAITGGTINGASIGATTRSTGDFTTISGNTVTSTTPVLGFNAANTIASFGTTTASSYNQLIIQNQSNTAGASTNYVVSNNLGTDSTYYGEFGMNSSTFSASTPADFYSINNGIYYSGHDGDVSIGSGNGFKTYLTYGTTGQSSHVINASGAIGLTTNLGTTPALSGTTGFGTSGQVLTSGGSAAPPTWTTPATGTVTSVAGTGTVNGLTLTGTVTSSGSLTLGGTLSLAVAPAIGSTTPSTAAFTTLSASSTVSGTGFTSYFASPPAIGGTAAAAGSFTTLTSSTSFTPTAYTETIVASGTVGASATLAITAGTVLTATLTSATACTFTMPTATAGKSFTLLLKQPASGTATTATFTGVKWNSSGAPTITATVGKLDILAFVADGTNWYGTASQGYTY